MAAYRGKRKETKEKRNQEIKCIMWKLEPVTIFNFQYCVVFEFKLSLIINKGTE
jgi:hypothetical protein